MWEGRVRSKGIHLSTITARIIRDFVTRGKADIKTPWINTCLNALHPGAIRAGLIGAFHRGIRRPGNSYFEGL
jgi:hypothetical protein